MPARPFSVNDLYGLYRTYEQGQRAGDESYNPALNSGFMSESQFNALPEQERMRLAGQYTTGGTTMPDASAATPVDKPYSAPGSGTSFTPSSSGPSSWQPINIANPTPKTTPGIATDHARC